MKRILFTIGIGVLTIFSSQAQSVSTWAGSTSGLPPSPGGHDKLGTTLFNPWGIAKDSKGHYWISCDDHGTGQILMVNTDNKVYSRAGQPTSPICGFKDGTGSSAEMNSVQGIAIDKNDTIFFCDAGNNAIRKLSPFSNLGGGQKVTTIAGGGGNLGSTNGTADTTDGQGYGSNGAYFNAPAGIGINPFTNDLIIADYSNSCIRGVKRTGKAYGTSYLIAGRKTGSGYVDGNPTSQAKFYYPSGIYVEQSSGDIYVAEGSKFIRKIPFNKATQKYDQKVTSIDLSKSISPAYLGIVNICAVSKSNSFSGSTYYFSNGTSLVKNNLSGSDKTILLAGAGISDHNGSDSAGFKNGNGQAALFSAVNNILDISTSSTSMHLLATDRENNLIRDIDLSGKFYTGVEEPKATVTSVNEGFKMYPNPAADYVVLENLAIQGGNETNIGVYDMTGKMISYFITDFTGRFTIPLNNLQKGIYIVKVQSEKEVFTSKVIVNK